MENRKASRRIHLLREDVANRIAAGEVIDRPLSIVRELLDNALDASCRSVDLWIERGGLDEVRVADDGAGMDAEDLELCYLPHATSKIETVEDLAGSTTLGFRGEALSSIGLCATLEVTSRPGEARAAHRLLVRDGRILSLEPCGGPQGTLVRVSGLFEHQPGRRQFLKSAGAESAQCAATFLDKAVAFPDVRFRFHVDGSLRHFLPACSLVERVGQAYPAAAAAGLAVVAGEREGLSVRVVLADPEHARRDRRFIQVFVNGRRIWEYSLVQAVEYGFTGTMPGGLHPVGFVFLSVDPALIDFNVHPAKREVRFRDPGAAHRLVAEVVKSFVGGRSSIGLRGVPSPRSPEGSPLPEAVLFVDSDAAAPAAVLDGAGEYGRIPAPGFPRSTPAVGSSGPQEAVELLGQVFGVFLVALRGDRLYLIDQHAAHERAIFDRLMEQAPEVQELLLPICFDLTEAELRHLESVRGELRDAGIVVETDSRGCEVTAMDARLSKVSESEIAELVSGRRGEPGSLRRSVCALAACSLAVRDGERLGEVSAQALAAEALGLPEARCPHGRPVWHSLSRGELFRLVKRAV